MLAILAYRIDIIVTYLQWHTWYGYVALEGKQVFSHVTVREKGNKQVVIPNPR